jgi:pyruvate,water dikinase
LELATPRWSETPDYILGLVRGYVQGLDGHNPIENQQRLAAERRALTESCLQRLRNPLKRWVFRRTLAQAQRLALNREQWKNEAVRAITVLRRMLLELGERLREGRVLEQRDDIFFLQISELEAVASGRAPADLPILLHSRRAEYAGNQALRPPPVVVGGLDGMAVLPAMPSSSAAGGVVLHGIPVSPGLVVGRARIILRDNEHDQVLPGEILVAPFTDPAWTPYFVTAAGIITDQGGILSHGSIVAREYGLPAVTNVGHATTTLFTGDLIQVDGNRGQVRLLERKSTADLQVRPPIALN